MVVMFSALHAGRPLHSERFLVLISLRGWDDLRARVKLEGLDQLKEIQWPLQESNPRLSGLQNSASNNYATMCPLIYVYLKQIHVVFFIRRWRIYVKKSDDIILTEILTSKLRNSEDTCI
jgi:hypothetical protein